MKTIKTLFLTLFFLFGIGFTPKASAESTVYIIMGWDVILLDPGVINIGIDGKHAFDMGLTLKSTRGIEKNYGFYQKAIQKIIFNEEGQFVISFDFVRYCDFHEHDEITLNLTDGSVHYVQMIGNRFNFKLLTEKEGLKKLSKSKKHTILPDYVYSAK